ncbi:MAG: GatB/YqeY domain-containing protein [bacterium]|jgi:uncharacterized protein YqeY
MTLNEKLAEDLKTAMKGQDEPRVRVLRMLKTRVKEASVAKRDDLTDDEVIKVIITETKKRKEAIELFEQGGRGDLAAREKEEMEILQTYMPEQLTEDEVRDLIKEAIEEVGAKDPRDMGKVMKVLMPRIVGRSEGSFASRTVKELLAQKKD